MRLSRYIDDIERIFNRQPATLAHAIASQRLLELGADREALREAFAQHILAPESLVRTHHPALLLDLSRRSRFSLGLNVFFPRADGSVTRAWNGVHHHGDLLLTSVVAFGSGYQYVMMAPPEHIREKLFRLMVVQQGLHKPGSALTVPLRHPHAVMAPAELTMTFALWSPHEWSPLDTIKRLPIFHRRERTLRTLAARLGLERLLALRLPHFHDYLPVEGGFDGMPERKDFVQRSAVERVQALCHAAQSADLDLEGEVARKKMSENPAIAPEAQRVIRDFVRGKRVLHSVSHPEHAEVPHFNLQWERILASSERP